MESLLRLISGQWTTYILWILHQNGATRFGELRRHVAGISAKVLTERVRMLEEANIVSRHYEPTVPPQVSYALTKNGEELMEVFEQMNLLAKRWSKQK